MILATHEMGDVHAHFGNWSGAINAWNDALDTLMGPYQVRVCLCMCVCLYFEHCIICALFVDRMSPLFK